MASGTGTGTKGNGSEHENEHEHVLAAVRGGLLNGLESESENESESDGAGLAGGLFVAPSIHSCITERSCGTGGGVHDLGGCGPDERAAPAMGAASGARTVGRGPGLRGGRGSDIIGRPRKRTLA